eukprot:1450677-Pleurochrysis_carterae.AAC.4
MRRDAAQPTLKKCKARYEHHYTSDRCNTKWQLVARFDAFAWMFLNLIWSLCIALNTELEIATSSGCTGIGLLSTET